MAKEQSIFKEKGSIGTLVDKSANLSLTSRVPLLPKL